MTSHQNAAKRLKALLRRTHFPVARLRQVQTTAPLPGGAAGNIGGGGGGGGGAGGGNPWDGIVSGDPRAALIVLHWTLLDMSPLFASLLLDRDYTGLHSLTDFKFVSRSLRMLRDEFNCRPQLTVSDLASELCVAPPYKRSQLGQGRLGQDRRGCRAISALRPRVVVLAAHRFGFTYTHTFRCSTSRAIGK